jgi:predicted SprT family Zn-dependent metalloprotease
MIPHLVAKLLDRYNLSSLGWHFKWDNALRRAGLCSYRRKVISLSRHYVALNIDNNFSDVIDTILHEIAHAITGPGVHHGPKWKEVCCQIGASPDPYYDVVTVKMPERRYVATCGGCGGQFRRHRKLSSGRRAYCTNCGPDVGRLTFLEAPTVKDQPSSTTENPPKPSRLRR